MTLSQMCLLLLISICLQFLINFEKLHKLIEEKCQNSLEHEKAYIYLP